jgi:hypothetical protein
MRIRRPSGPSFLNPKANDRHDPHLRKQVGRLTQSQDEDTLVTYDCGTACAALPPGAASAFISPAVVLVRRQTLGIDSVEWRRECLEFIGL